VAKAEKGGANNATRQHYQMATGAKPAMKKGGAVCAPTFVKGAKMAPKSGRK
jgi:hypothetical protein